MDSQPPNNPNNNNHNNNNRIAAKEDPFDGNLRRRTNNGSNEEGPVDILGDMRDSPAVVVMFLVGVASWFLRERCIC